MQMNIHDPAFQEHIRKMCRFMHKTKDLQPEERVRIAITQGLISEEDGERYLPRKKAL